MKIKGLLIGVFLFVSTVYAEQSMEALISFNNYAYFSAGNISLEDITIYESAKGQNISRLNLRLKICNIEARDTRSLLSEERFRITTNRGSQEVVVNAGGCLTWADNLENIDMTSINQRAGAILHYEVESLDNNRGKIKKRLGVDLGDILNGRTTMRLGIDLTDFSQDMFPQGEWEVL